MPNACNRCHTTRDAGWAATQVSASHGNRAGPDDVQRFALAFAEDDQGSPGAGNSLAAVAADLHQPAIVRASALARLSRLPGPVAFAAAQRSAGDPVPMVRLAALQILERAPAQQRLALVVPMLGDPTRAVRQGAAWVLAPISASIDGASARRAFAVAAQEFVASQQYNGDQPSNRLTLGMFYTQFGEFGLATTEFRAALRLAPSYAQRYPGLAAEWRKRGWTQAADAILRALEPADR